MEKLAAKREDNKREKTTAARGSGHAVPKEHVHLLQNRTASSLRLRDELVNRVGGSDRKSRRSGTALEIKRKASVTGLGPARAAGSARVSTRRSNASARTLPGLPPP